MPRPLASFLPRAPLFCTILLGATLVGAAHAQVDATFSHFGAGCPGTGTGLGDNHVLPANMATRFGAGNAIPFSWSPVRFQQVFDGADLPTVMTMAGLSLRQAPSAPISHGYIVDLEIAVGRTTKTAATMSTTFASNFDSGTPIVVVPRAQIVVPDSAPGRHFLVQVTIHGNSYGNSAIGYPWDSASSPSTARLYGSPATATSGTLERNLGVVMGLRALTHTAVPNLYSDNTPQIGDSFRVRVKQARASSPAMMLLGFSTSSWGSQSLPLELGFLGAPGCSLLTAIDAAQSFSINTGATGNVVYSVPNDFYLLGLHFYQQALILDSGANAFGVALSNGGNAGIGNQ
ncbi:MAG: hypothetical protein IT457_21735 [Planctomycetes bacterium]|nr:hypothetical protein [Planctomycetota bacterium]